MEEKAASRRRGRSRSFDVEEVAGKAALLFWRRGYEGVSVDELTAAMGITTASFYAAFGSKEVLHREALAWYEREIAGPIREALAGEPDVVQAILNALRRCALEFTRPGRPAGCMRSMAGLSVSGDNEAVGRLGTDLRLQTAEMIKERLDRGVSDHQLAPCTDTRALALYLNALVVGMSVAAQDGARAEELRAVADLAVSAFSATHRP